MGNRCSSISHFGTAATRGWILLFIGCSGTGTTSIPDTNDATADSRHDVTIDLGGELDTVDVQNEPTADLPEDTATTSWCEGSYAVPVDVAMSEPELLEASGLVASRMNEGVLWLHNDSGDGPRLFAVREDGAALGRLTLRDATARDWEDIATATCPDGTGHCLWIGDVGDNLMSRDDAALYAVREPVIDGPIGEMNTDDFWRFPVRYGDERPNVEALMVSADATDFWIIEKVPGDTARIFHTRGPLQTSEATDFAVVGSFTSPGANIGQGRLVTGADLHHSGRRVLVRVYTGSFEYRLAADQSPADLGSVEPVLVAPGPLTEPQGEAIAYSASGKDVWSISESLDPLQPLHLYLCTD